MIKNYKLFTEGILDKLKGPSYDDVLKNKTPDGLLKFCFNNLDGVGVEYALEHGASEELYNKLLEMEDWFLDLIIDLKEYISDKYPDYVFWKKNDKILFEQNLKTNILWINYYEIWSVFKNEYNYKYDDIQLFIKNMVEEHLNWKGFIPNRLHYKRHFPVEEHLNWKGFIPSARSTDARFL